MLNLVNKYLWPKLIYLPRYDWPAAPSSEEVELTTVFHRKGLPFKKQRKYNKNVYSCLIFCIIWSEIMHSLKLFSLVILISVYFWQFVVF